jgi:hypothetical protein
MKSAQVNGERPRDLKECLAELVSTTQLQPRIKAKGATEWLQQRCGTFVK